MQYDQTILAVLGLLIVVLACVGIGVAAWSARKQRERLAELVDNWCADVANDLEARARTPLQNRPPLADKSDPQVGQKT